VELIGRGHNLRELPLGQALLFGENYKHVVEQESMVVQAGVLEAVDKIEFN